MKMEEIKRLFMAIDDRLEKIGQLWHEANTRMNMLSVVLGYSKIVPQINCVFVRRCCPICGGETFKGPEIILTLDGDRQLCYECIQKLAPDLWETAEYILEYARSGCNNDIDTFYKILEEKFHMLEDNMSPVTDDNKDN